jgi:arylsulfatase A-like enzyme
VRWPDGVKPGTTVTGLTEAIDVVPTILDLCAIPIPKSVQGRSFRPALEGDATYRRTCALTESVPCSSIRTDTHRYVCYKDGRELLFEHESDPGEYVDLSQNADAAETLAEVRLLMIQKMLETNLSKPREWAY